MKSLNSKYGNFVILIILFLSCHNPREPNSADSRDFGLIIDFMEKSGYNCDSLSEDTLGSILKILRTANRKKELTNFYVNVAKTTSPYEEKNYYIFNYGLSLDIECPAKLSYEIVKKETGDLILTDTQLSQNHEFKLKYKKDSSLLLKYNIIFCYQDTTYIESFTMPLD